MHRSYFLGSPTPNGFETRFSDEIKSGMYTVIIKGGPGTGKSTVMKKIASALEDVDPAELYYCSSDPDSLDAVLFRGLGLIFVDGTAPHVFEPQYPGARQTILNLGRFWNADQLKASADGIISLTEKNAALHARVRRYLGASHDLGGEIISVAEQALYREKLEGYISRLSRKLFGKSNRPRGKVSIRQITSVTPKGVMTQESALEGCRVFRVEDPFYAASDMLLKGLSQAAAAAGYDVVASRNVFLPQTVYEEIVIEELGLAFSTRAGGDDLKKINGLRFYDRDLLRQSRRKLSFASALRRELSKAAVEALKEAKDVHDDLEKYYSGAMDFEKSEKFCDGIIKALRESAGK